MTYFLYGLFLLSCIVLVVAVLLQPGKADAGALFTSSVSSTAFGPRGTQTILAKITIAAAALFMLVALTLSLPIVTGSRSVVSGETDEAPAQPAASPATAPATAPAQNTAAPAAAMTPAAGGEATAPAANTNATEGNANNANNATPQSSPQQNK